MGNFVADENTHKRFYIAQNPYEISNHELQGKDHKFSCTLEMYCEIHTSQGVCSIYWRRSRNTYVRWRVESFATFRGERYVKQDITILTVPQHRGGSTVAGGCVCHVP